MDGTQVSAITEILMNILLGSFSIATIIWALVGAQMFINDRKEEKRDEEYHAKLMKE